MMCSTAGHGTGPPRQPPPGTVRGIVWMVLLLSSVVIVDAPYSTWAAVHQCQDAAGKSVLTNRPSQLRNCHVFIEENALSPMPPAASTTPQVSASPLNSDTSLAPSYTPPMPPNRPVDTQGASMNSLPAPNQGASSSLSPPQPCSRGLNPLNPLSSPPCVQKDQSGTKLPGN